MGVTQSSELRELVDVCVFMCMFVYTFCGFLHDLFQLVELSAFYCFFYLGFLDEITMKEPRGGYEIHIMPKLFPNTTIAVEEIYIFKISIVTY